MLQRVAMSGINPRVLAEKTISVFGVGGLGSIVAEMLVRVGVGKLILVDKDIVGPENFNRLGFDVEDIGKPKVEAIAKKLKKIGEIRGKDFPLEIETYYTNVIGWGELPNIVERSDLIFTCFDNPEARLEVNFWAVKKNKVLIDGGTSEDGLRGRIITVVPYKTPCLNCYFGEGTIMEVEENIILITEACNASLPTTMAIVASLQVDQGLKYLLNKQIVPLIFVNLEEDPIIVVRKDVKRRKNCEVCGVEEK